MFISESSISVGTLLIITDLLGFSISLALRSLIWFPKKVGSHFSKTSRASVVVRNSRWILPLTVVKAYVSRFNGTIFAISFVIATLFENFQVFVTIRVLFKLRPGCSSAVLVCCGGHDSVGEIVSAYAFLL